MYEVGGEAVSRARGGNGPTLIEAQTYRYMGHFGADNPLTYRTAEEEARFKSRDCIDRLTSHLLEAGIVTKEDLASVDQEASDSVSAAAKFADESPFPQPEELYTDVYVSYPSN